MKLQRFKTRRSKFFRNLLTTRVYNSKLKRGESTAVNSMKGDKPMNNLERMGNAEAEIMKILWERKGKPATSPEIRKALKDKVEWARSTILTLLRRLVEKGFVACEKGDVFSYTPLVSEEEYIRYQTHNFIDRIYDGSVKNLLSALCRANSLSKKDIEELQLYLEREASRND
jgi:BlaI family penicillinase repressor